jgi:hypothetical protein
MRRRSRRRRGRQAHDQVAQLLQPPAPPRSPRCPSGIEHGGGPSAGRRTPAPAPACAFSIPSSAVLRRRSCMVSTASSSPAPARVSRRGDEMEESEAQGEAARRRPPCRLLTRSMNGARLFVQCAAAPCARAAQILADGLV